MHDMPMDLGYSMDGPESPMKPREKMYPSLHLEWPEDYDLPESGEMTVTFRKTHESKSKRGGKTTYTVDLEIRSINSIEEEEGEPHDENAEEESGAEALDRLKAEKDKESENEYD